jgi:hypothetical protein
MIEPVAELIVCNRVGVMLLFVVEKGILRNVLGHPISNERVSFLVLHKSGFELIDVVVGFTIFRKITQILLGSTMDFMVKVMIVENWLGRSILKGKDA